MIKEMSINLPTSFVNIANDTQNEKIWAQNRVKCLHSISMFIYVATYCVRHTKAKMSSKITKEYLNRLRSYIEKKKE